jgi:hypothetical protein
VTPEARQDFIDSLCRDGLNHQTAARLVDTLSHLQAQIDGLAAPPRKEKTK